jgi:flagellar biosynthesis/type III secretory pathway M-ring protein FliF/YscJ
VLVLVTLVWMLRRKRPRHKDVTMPAELPAGASTGASLPPAAGQSMEDQLESKLAERSALERKLEAQALSSLKLAPVITKTAEVLAKHLREKIAKEPDVAAQVLRTWIRDEEA